MNVRVALALVSLVVACKEDPPRAAIGSEPREAAATAATAASTSTTTSTSTGVRVMAAADDADAISLIRTERLKAKADDRVLVVYVGATWCPPCKKLKQELASGRLDRRLAKVTLLEFDADRDAERLAAAGYTFKFIPFVALPGADGRPADTQEATGKGEGAWTELLGKLDAWQR